ncbi:ankyrin repeat-containing domain protein [Boletus reticuloceps]|uniref:Ankyrin repeat-containing domain protein n=1 Tax=Boletus reticuloceps TaxID=495285 RepID=A0A8I2YVI8_9AGAM|nr:ankyrin repeat-containing domain protein [Boletus reticuloceps]
MERSGKIFREIASAANKVIASANEYADRKDSWSVGDSHFQLEDEMRRVSVACACIADILDKSNLPTDGPEFDVRLRDWLATDEPKRYRETLIWMEGLFEKKSWVYKIFRTGRAKAPTGDRIKEAAEYFNSRKVYFYFLSLAEIWNNEKSVQVRQQQDNCDVVQGESDVLEPGLSTGIPTEINNFMLDPAVHRHTDHVIQEGSNILDQSSLVPARTDLNTVPDMANHKGRYTARQKRQETMSDEKGEKGEHKLEEVVKWLDGLNCAEKQDDTLSLRQPDTCNWLFDTPQYKMWRDGGDSFLWLKGKPGAGKSVLASSVINSLETSLCKGEILAFFYCDFRNERSTSPAEALCSILSQLLRRLHGSTVNPVALLEALVKAKERGGSVRNNARALAGFVCRVAALSNEKPLVIIDALDECNDVTSLLQALMAIRDHVRLFVTSRPLHVIMRGLSGLPSISMDDMEGELLADIGLHVTKELDARLRLRDLDAAFKAEIRSFLCKKAGGMFRWIQCSINTLDQCVSRKEVRNALNSLPEGLDETYERILLRIDMKHREGQLARRALTWLVAAVRPLQISELMEGLSINLQTRTLDRDSGPMHHGALLEACGSLVTCSEKTGIIVLSHFSVMEYLTGKLILMKLPQYHIDWNRAHLQLAQSCVCYLRICLRPPLGNSSNIPVDIFGGFSGLRTMSLPLLDYVFNDAIDHFRHLGSRFIFVLHDIKLLAHDIHQHSRMWNNLCRSARRKAGSATPIWPISKHDLMLYILVAYAPNSFLQKFLRHAGVKPKERTNPLVYAAYFNKEDHARTLLSRGCTINRRGWDVDGFFQVFPIEVALQTCHYSMVTLFVEEGSTVPPHVFANVFSLPERLSNGIPSSIAKMLYQTDDFVEAVDDPLNGDVSPPVDIYSLQTEDTYEHDIIEILRRFIQIGWHNNILLSLFNGSPLFIHRELSLASIIQPLVKSGANVHARTATGDTVLHTALRSSWNESYTLEVAKALVSHGCDPREESPSGETPLYIAVNDGFVSVTHYLLSLGISPPPDLLRVALSLRDRQKKAQMIVCLVENGVDVRARTAAGDPAFHIALQSLLEENDALEVARAFVSHGCDPLEASSSGETPLHIAVKLGFVSATRYLLSLGISPPPDLLDVASTLSHWKKPKMIVCLVENGANVHTFNAAGDSVLHTTLRCLSSCIGDNALGAAKTLVGHGCDPLVASSSGETPLHVAVNRGLVSVARYLLSLGTSSPPFPNLLHVALSLRDQQERAQMIVFLIENGADTHARTATGDPAFHMALQSLWDDNYALKVVKAFVSHGCDPLEASSSGATPLHIATRRGFLSAARYLLSFGITPPPDLLHVASSFGRERERVSMIVSLVESGADVHACTAAGDNMLHTALQELWDEDNALEVAKALISHGCDPLKASPSGEIPLHIAVKRGLVTVARYLLSLGLSPSSYLLHTASRLKVERKRALMVACLVEKGANVHAHNAAGDTVLHTALKAPSEEDYVLETAKVLVCHGCDPLQASSSGESPLDIAVKRGLVSVARYLLSLGIPPSPDLLYVASSLLDEQAALSMINGRKKAQMIVCLVEGGADVHAYTATGDPVLHTTLQSLDPFFYDDEKYALEAAELLVSHGCDPLEASSSGETPLHIAVKRGFVSVARYLCSLGSISPSPNLLHIASSLKDERRRASMIVCLVDNGANIHARNVAGDTVLHSALQSLWDENYVLKIAKALVNRGGCDPLAESSSSGETPLRIAVNRGFVSVVRHFLSLGTSPPVDLLHVVSSLRDQWSSASMIVCLIENGANVHTRTTAGDTLLHTTLKAPSKEKYILKIARVLVCHGCDPLEASSCGKTPLHIAVERGFVFVARYFLSLGALPSSDLLLVALLSQPEYGQRDILRWLENGGDIHIRTSAATKESWQGYSISSSSSLIETLKLLNKGRLPPQEFFFYFAGLPTRLATSCGSF